jgi:hypothetical protein
VKSVTTFHGTLGIYRTAKLKWRGASPGLPADMATEFLAAVKSWQDRSHAHVAQKGCEPANCIFDRFKKHCELHRISKINASIGKRARFRDRTECRNGHPFQEITYTFPQTGGVDPATTRARPSSVRGSGSQSNPIPEGGRHDRQHH